MDHFFALIMAGGGGTRLWPLSRRNRPKQVLPLTEERTMFQVTVDRLRDEFPPERIFVVTGRDMADAMRQITPHIPAENFLIEPSGRDSGPAAGWGTLRIYEQDPDAVIVDVRNRYESAVGKFENAVACDIEHFRELPDYVEQLFALKATVLVPIPPDNKDCMIVLELSGTGIVMMSSVFERASHPPRCPSDPTSPRLILKRSSPPPERQPRATFNCSTIVNVPFTRRRF